jgi:type III secretion protein V
MRRHQSPLVRKLLEVVRVTPDEKPRDTESSTTEPILKPLPGVVFEVSPDLIELHGAERLLNSVTRVADSLREEFGAPIPNPVVRPSSELTANLCRLRVFGIRLQEMMLLPTGVDEGFAQLERYLEQALRSQLGQFAGIQETSNLLNQWSREYPDLIKEMLRAAAPQRVSEVLRRLLEEGIPIRQLRDVFEAIADVSTRERDVLILTEQVRVALRRHITQRHLGPNKSINALIAHPELEDALRQALRGAGPAGQVAIDPQLLQRVANEIRAVRGEQGAAFGRVVMLCSMDVRRHLRKLTEGEFFELPVLSFQELSGDVPVVPVGQVRG